MDLASHEGTVHRNRKTIRRRNLYRRGSHHDRLRSRYFFPLGKHRTRRSHRTTRETQHRKTRGLHTTPRTELQSFRTRALVRKRREPSAKIDCQVATGAMILSSTSHWAHRCPLAPLNSVRWTVGMVSAALWFRVGFADLTHDEMTWTLMAAV